MTARQAIAFVRKHGIVLESARGAVPSLAAAIVGEEIHGSWWSHPESQKIFALTRAVRNSDDVLVCRLVAGKITYVHRRLWPALVKRCSQFQRKRLALVRELHTASGRHETKEVPFPKWVPASVFKEAAELTEEAATRSLGSLG